MAQFPRSRNSKNSLADDAPGNRHATPITATSVFLSLNVDMLCCSFSPMVRPFLGFTVLWLESLHGLPIGRAVLEQVK